MEYEFVYDDYAQSANTLFHFMKRPEYLKEILLKKAIVPRYCKEDVGYLKVQNDGTFFREILVLQKCFCDIPFHKLAESFSLTGTGEVYQNLTEEERAFLSANNTHPDFYGEYAVGFSKSWGEKANLQPVHYLNEQSRFADEFSHLIESTLQAEDIPDLFAGDILNRLAFIKPLRGIMKRRFKRGNGDEVEVEFVKNFHDEQEWRYVPGSEALAAMRIDHVIANPEMLRMGELLLDVNEGLTGERYRPLWIPYRYEDIRYLIVPNVNARFDLLRTIQDIPDGQFGDQDDILTQKYILASKILVLDEIRKDW